MFMRIMSAVGIALLGAGYFWMRTQRASGNSPDGCLVLMGAGALLLLFPGYRLAVTGLGLPGGGNSNKKFSNLLTETRFRFVCIAAVIIGIVGMKFSPGGFNNWTLGFIGLTLLAVGSYAAVYVRLGPPGRFSNLLRFLVGTASACGLMAGAVTLIIQLSGASDMPDRWNVYSFMGLIGLAASIYGGYYALNYQTDTDVVELLEPLGFTLADSGPLGRDGKYDARGVWKGIGTLVNVNQIEWSRDCPPSFYLEISCEAPGWAGRRLLVHPKGYLHRPLGVPLLLPSAPPVAGWEDCGVYCDPPEAAPVLLRAIAGGGGPSPACEGGFAYLLLDKGRLVLGFSREGHPSREYLVKMMDLAAGSARAIS